MLRPSEVVPTQMTVVSPPMPTGAPLVLGEDLQKIPGLQRRATSPQPDRNLATAAASGVCSQAPSPKPCWKSTPSKTV